MFETLEITREGAISTVWMNRPDRHNAFNAQVIAELSQAFTTLNDDKATHVVILAGRGKNFSAGADLAWMKAAGEASFEDNLADARKLAEMFRLIAESPKPTIARVHGAALGGGMGLAAVCDICIASRGASFATTEVKFGIIPSAISPYLIRAIGPRYAARYFLTAERIDATRAVEIGLAHELVEAEQIDRVVGDLATRLASNGPQAQAAAKALIRDFANVVVDADVREDTARRIATLRTGAEAREGLTSFLEKRAPRWTE
jgi:methylglutaconyl-CoA hydratase